MTKAPMDVLGWQALMQRTLTRLRLLGRRNMWLEQAYMNGKSEDALRRLGILSDTDLDREFPSK